MPLPFFFACVCDRVWGMSAHVEARKQPQVVFTAHLRQGCSRTWPGVLGIHPPLRLQHWDYKSAQPQLGFYDAFSRDHAAHVWEPESDIMSDATPRSHLKMIPFLDNHLDVVISLNFLILPPYFGQKLQGHNDGSQAVIAKPEHLAVWIARASCTQLGALSDHTPVLYEIEHLLSLLWLLTVRMELTTCWCACVHGDRSWLVRAALERCSWAFQHLNWA